MQFRHHGLNPDNGHQFFRSIVDGLPLALFCKDYYGDTGRIVAWNVQAEKLWGLKFEDVYLKSDYDIFPKEQADFFKSKDIETLKKNNIVFIPEEKADSSNGGQVWVRTWKIPLPDASGKARYLLGVCQEISEIKHLEEELRMQSEKALLTTHLENQALLAQQITHELNNPLAIILGKTQFLKKWTETQSVPEEVRQAILSIAQTTKATAEKIDSLLNVFSEKNLVPDALEQAESATSNNAELKFQHDFSNMIAIAMGRSKQAQKIILKNNNPNHTEIDILEKIKSISEVLQRMEVSLEAQRNKTPVQKKRESA